MKRFLLTPPSKFTHFYLRTLAVLLLLTGVVTPARAQCIGPYQNYESFGKANAATTALADLQGKGWAISPAYASIVANAPNARSGTGFFQITANTSLPYLQTPLLATPDKLQFYYRSSTINNNVNLIVEWSYDINFGSVISSTNIVTTGTGYITSPTIDLSSWSNIYVRVRHVSLVTPTPGASTFIDDFTWTSRTTADNKIIVPAPGATTCTPVNVPAAGNGTLSFYDQGGSSDTYNKSQTHIVHFAPNTFGEKVKITFNSCTLDALTPVGTIVTNITVYNGNGTTAGTEFAGLNATTTVSAGTTVTSTDANGYITVKFITTNSTATFPAAAATNTPGFDATVECVSAPTITALTGSGCAGGTLVITGTNLGGATAVTVGGVAVSAIGANTATSLTVTPAAGSSGTVSVTTAGGSVTSVATYTANALPTISAQPSTGTQLICLNGSSTALSVTAAAGSGTIQKYEWYSNTTASTTGATLVATNTTAATTNTYTPLTTALGTLYYYVVVTNSNGCNVTSTFTGGITINAPVAITGQPSTSVQTVCVGSAITTLSVTATGGGLNYQWYSNTTNSNVGGTSLGVTAMSSTYTPSNASAMATTYYYCVVSNGAPCSSSVASAVSGAITVNAVPTTVTVSSAGSFCTNTTLTASNGGSGTMYYQGTTSGGTSTATPSSSQLISASGTYYFRAFNGSCWSAEGSAAVIIVAAPGSVTTAAPTAVTANSFTGSWTAVAGATGYYLDVSTDSGFTALLPAYSNLSIGNVLNYVVTGLNSSTLYYYRVRAFNGTCSGPNVAGQSCTTSALAYCLPSGAGFGQDPLGITNVTMGTINNTTVRETNNYGDYTALSTDVYAGATQSFSVTYRTGFTYDTTVWVDWNNDGDFADTGELVYQGNSTNSIPTTLSGSFAVPLLNSNGMSTVGLHRVRIGGTDFGPLTDPCRAGAWQAFEDYTLNVLTVPPCAISTPSALTTVNVIATGASLVWSDPAMTPNTVYNYWVSTSNVAPPADGSNPAGMGTVTGALSANVSGLTLGVTYYFWVRVKCSAVSYSAWIGSASFTTTNLDVVNMTSGSITTCNAKFYDSGSFSGSYSSSENSTYTFTPATGTNLKVVFNSFVTEPGFDFLSIYDGPTTASPLLGTFSGSQIAAGQTFYSSTANGGSLTFRFISDPSLTRAGWDASITCVSVPTVTSFSPLFTCAGSTPLITITGTNFTGASSVTFNGAAAAYTVVNSTTITATLPASATTGVIRVTTPNASGVSTASFAVRPIPATPNAGADVAICNGQSTPLNIVVPPAVNSLATTQLGGNGCTGGNMFNIVTGSNPISITSFDITPNNTGLQNVRVYYKTGTYIGSETTAGAWTLLGTYSVNGVAKVLVNMPVTNLPLLASTTYGIYINYDASYTDGTNSYTNGEITINTGAGLCGLFTLVNASRTFNGVVRYDVTSNPTYTWTPATGLSSATIVNPIASPTTTTTYNVTTTINGCTSASDNVVVTVNPVPTTSIPTAGGNVCANAVVPVTVTGSGSTYTWSSSVANTLFTDATGLTAYVAGSNATNVYVKTPTTATITVTGTSLPGGCFTTAAVTFTVVTKTFNSGFWAPGGPPANDGTENLVFNAGTYTSSGDLSACSCSVTGANVTFATGHTLSLVNGLTVTSGSMTFNSGATLLQQNPVANTGAITYRRDSTPCFKNDYTYWSSPVAGQTLTGLSPATTSTGFFDYNAAVSSWQQTPFASVMSLGKGYLIRVPNSYPVSPALPINFTANFVGVPNNGTIPVNIVHNPANDLNLIGNPYPSAINAAALVTDPVFNANGSFLGGTIYLWSHNSNVNYVTGQYDQTDYAVWNILGGVNTYYTGFVGAGNSNAPTGNIVAGQGFFIKTVGSGTAYFRNTMRTGGATNSNSNFYRTGSPSAALDPTADFEKHRIWLDVNNGAQAYKQLLLGYIEGGTDGLDRLFDGEMVDNGNTVLLYTTVEAKRLSIQGRGLTFTPNDTFALGFKTTVADSYSINLSDFDGLFTTQAIYLEDRLLNVIHDLKVSPYAFSSAAGVFEDRFVLRFTNTTLGTTPPVFNENTVLVYKNEQGLFINSGSKNMKNVHIYDIRGRELATQKQVGKTTTIFTNLPATQQVLLVKIEGENGETVTKKIVF